VIFGDAPGHDPICAAISGLDHDITEESVTAKLHAAVRAVSVTVSLSSDCPEPLSVSFAPASQSVPSGSIAEFTETFAAASDATEMTIRCNTYLLINGTPVPGVIETNEITIVAQAPSFTG